MVTKLIDVNSIRFTQEHVYDSFNANSERAGGVVELINDIISGSKTPADLPLIRVAAKKGAYWCVDNRRLFVYKHCQLGEIPVQVFSWKDNREFELKWRNGLASRAQTGKGARVGILQRTDTPFPLSPVAEESLSKIHTYMSREEQRHHDAGIEALRRCREQKSSAGKVRPGVQEEALRKILESSHAVAKGKKRKGATRVGPPAKRKQSGAESGTSAVKLTVTMDQEDSSDEAYAIEVVAG